jgi:hypothetical protein
MAGRVDDRSCILERKWTRTMPSWCTRSIEATAGKSCLRWLGRLQIQQRYSGRRPEIATRAIQRDPQAMDFPGFLQPIKAEAMPNKGRPLIIIVRPKASSTDCYASLSEAP